MNKRSVLSLAAALVFALSGCESTTDNAASSDTTTEVTERAQDHSDNIEIANTTETSDEAVNIEQTEETVVPEQWNPEIPQRAELKDDGYICAVAYVGFVDADMDALQCAEVFNNSGYSSEFPMLSDIPQSNCIDDCQGYELYLVIPTDENATVAVNEWLLTEENEYSGEAGAVYYKSEVGAPVLIKCNVSDIMPNVVVSVTDSDGNSMQWHPSISLKDGSVSRYGVEDVVCDITHYIYNETYECYSFVD